MKRTALSIILGVISLMYCVQIQANVLLPFGQKTNSAQSVDITSTLVAHSDVELTITNDATNPWISENGALKNGNCGVANSASVLKCSFTSAYKTEILFDWMCYNNYRHQPLEVFVDGVSKGTTSNSSYQTKRFILDAGEHVIVFRDSIGNYSSTYNYSYIKNLKVKEFRPLETAVLTENSLPIAFNNDAEYPWSIEDGFIQSGNYDVGPSVSRISTTITVDTASVLSFERQVSPSANWSSSTWIGSRYIYNYDHYSIAYVDGEEYMKETNVESFKKMCLYLEPGTHTIEWLDTIARSTSTKYYTCLRNVELHKDWIDIELTTPGTLGVEVLYQVNVLNDVQLLKVKGAINSADWTNISQMKNLVGLDLSEAKFDAVPANAFDGHSFISGIKLPEGMTSIGDYAFQNSSIKTINIPSTTHTIGQYAFYGCKYLAQMLLPNALTSLGQYAFYGCGRLTKLHFSDNLKNIPNRCCYDCYELKDLHLPNNLNEIGGYAFYQTDNLRKVQLPEGLNTIKRNAFQYSGVDSVRLPIKMSYLYNAAFANCSNLTYVELPVYLNSYNNGSSSYGYYSNFNNCPLLKTVVCKSATPPAILSDPFADGPSKTNITLEVPAFAVTNYKLDTYWYQFGVIEAIPETPTNWRIGDDMVLYNNDPIDVKPDVLLLRNDGSGIYLKGGSLTVNGNQTLSMNSFTMEWAHNDQYSYSEKEQVYCTLINNSHLRSDCVSIDVYTPNNRWAFFSLPFDVRVSEIEVLEEGSTNWVIRKYDGEKRALGETAETWVKMAEDDVLKAGEGYIIQSSRYIGTSSQSYSGFRMSAVNNANKNNIFINTDATVTLNEYLSEFAHNRSWNLIGNPYPSYYDTRFMDFTAPITVWNMNNNTYTAYSPSDDSYILCPGEAFFVQCPIDDTDILFSKDGRQKVRAVRTMGQQARRKVAAMSEHRAIVNLSVSDGTYNDKTRIVLNESASMDYEMDKDASKFMSTEMSVPQLYTSNAGVNYAINERPVANGKVDLCTRFHADGQYTITLDSQLSDYSVELYDKKLNKKVMLSVCRSYSFFAESGEEGGRFTVYFSNGETGVTDDVMADESAHDIYTVDGKKVDAPVQKGVYVRNGKKMVVK